MEILLVAAGLVAALLLGGLAYQVLATAADRRRFPPPGRMVDGLHFFASGQGNPAVIFESGISASCLNWTQVRTEVARFTLACSYDRAGLGWSDPASTPRVPSRIVDELHALLSAAKIPPPYILVGHSFGGMLARVYASKYPEQVAGLVLLDPLQAADWLNVTESQSKMLRRGVRLSRRGALLARFGLVRLSLRLLSGGARRIPRWIAKLTSGRGESVLSRLIGEVQKMPPETWPMIQAHWCQPKSFLGMAAYLESLPASAAEAACANPGAIPVTILSAGNSTPAQLAERGEMARRSRHGKHQVAPNSGHWIHLDNPDLVIQAIREMVGIRVAH